MMLNNKLEVNKAEGCVGAERNSSKDLIFSVGKFEQNVYIKSRQVMCDNVLVIRYS